MEKVTICYHKDMDTMDIWFDNPENEVISEKAGDGIILKKDNAIGIEELYVTKTLGLKQSPPVELVVA